MIVGEAMRRARLAKGLSITKLAKKAGCDPSTITYAEQGKHLPNLFTLINLADALGVSLDEYVGRNGDGKT